MFSRIDHHYNLLNALLRSEGSNLFEPQLPMALYERIEQTQLQKQAAFRAKVDGLMAQYEAQQKSELDSVALSEDAQEHLTKTKKVYADLETAALASEQAKMANRARLENAGNRIIGWNEHTMIQDSMRALGTEPNYINDEYFFYGPLVSANECAFNRQMTNRQIENIFAEHGIEVPQDTDLYFTVDPYDYIITVSGTDDEALKAQIEEALNKDDNGKSLYEHIYLCSKDNDSAQVNLTAQAKRFVFRLIRKWTGADLRECTRAENDFITPDGKSVTELLHNYVDTHEPDYREELKAMRTERMLKYDYNDGNDQVLSIRYTSTGLHDIGQENGYGTGKTGWILELKDKIEAERGKKTFTVFV